MINIKEYMKQPPYSWLRKVDGGFRKTSGQLANITDNTILVEGTRGTGKTELFQYLADFGMRYYGLKPFIMWVENMDFLKENLTFMFPNNMHKEPTSYNTVILVPFTTNLARKKKLPNNFIPFVIPIDKLGDHTLSAIFGIQNVEKYSKEYHRKLTSPNITYSSMKSYLSKKSKKKDDLEKFMENSVKTSDMGYRYVAVDSDYSTEEKVKRAFGIFNERGLISDPKFRIDGTSYILDDIFKWILDYPKSIVIILYLGYETDRWLKRFVWLYVMESLRRVSQSYDYMPLRNVVMLPELQDLSKPNFSKDTEDIDVTVNSMLMLWLGESRHWNCDIWADSKPNVIEPKVRDLFSTCFITNVGSTRILSDLVQNSQHSGKKISDIFAKREYRARYGFIDLKDSRIPMWKFKKSWTYGYRLFERKSIKLKKSSINDVEKLMGKSALILSTVQKKFVEDRNKGCDGEVKVQAFNIKTIGEQSQERVKVVNRVMTIEIASFLTSEYVKNGYDDDYMFDNWASWANRFTEKWGVNKVGVYAYMKQWKDANLKKKIAVTTP